MENDMLFSVLLHPQQLQPPHAPSLQPPWLPTSFDSLTGSYGSSANGSASSTSGAGSARLITNDGLSSGSGTGSSAGSGAISFISGDFPVKVIGKETPTALVYLFSFSSLFQNSR